MQRVKVSSSSSRLLNKNRKKEDFHGEAVEKMQSTPVTAMLYIRVTQHAHRKV